MSSLSMGQADRPRPTLEETSMKIVPALAAAAAVLLGAGAVQAQTMVKHIQSDKSFIATGVWAGDTYYLSGQLADPITPADPVKNIPAVYSTDTGVQAASVFAKIKKALQAQGLDMKDVVKLTVFLGPDPKTGKLDFKGMNTEYMKYFGTPDQPNKPARSAFQVAALAAPWGLLEVEAIAVRSH
jgi:enamine deaminase RidA (YjgF/YER057c/UK114 family)